MCLTGWKISLMILFFQLECIGFPTSSGVSLISYEHRRPHIVSMVYSHMHTPSVKIPTT